MHQPLTPASQRIKQPTAHLFYLSNVHPLPKPRITFKLLCVHLPLGQEADLVTQLVYFRRLVTEKNAQYEQGSPPLYEL
jgi:hypothetical protein